MNSHAMHVRPIDDVAAEAPFPVLFNAWKHHAAAIRFRLAHIATVGEQALQQLPRELRVVGSDLMDLYTGTLSPSTIGRKVLDTLTALDRVQLDDFRTWLTAGSGYQVLTIPEDDSRWVVRVGDENDRYIHVHPARRAPATRRVRSNVLKTAIMVLAYTGLHGGNPRDVLLINEVRQRYLVMAPIKRLSGADGLESIIGILGTHQTLA